MLTELPHSSVGDSFLGLWEGSAGGSGVPLGVGAQGFSLLMELSLYLGFPGGSTVKNPLAEQEIRV